MHKVIEADRRVYRIDIDSLGVRRTSADVHTSGAQRTTAGEELARIFTTRLGEIARNYTHELGEALGQPGAERERRYQAERERDDIKRDFKEIRPLSRPQWVFGLLVIVAVATLIALALGAIMSGP